MANITKDADGKIIVAKGDLGSDEDRMFNPWMISGQHITGLSDPNDMLKLMYPDGMPANNAEPEKIKSLADVLSKK